MIQDATFWRSYAGQMLSLARHATTPRVKTLWLNGAARARRELAALKSAKPAKPAQQDLFS